MPTSLRVASVPGGTLSADLADPASPGEAGGLIGFALTLMNGIGEWGVALFTLLETVFPPIPSEIVLPLAGYLAQLGRMNMVLVIVLSTLGAYAGALLLYALGTALGLERAIRLMSRLPLVDREDFEKAANWFRAHGRSAVFFGRLVPGIRSLISLPAGAERMHLATFSVFTLAGSLLWNSLLIGLGAALGTQYELIDQYSSVLNWAVYAALAGVVVWLVVRRVRRGRGGQQGRRTRRVQEAREARRGRAERLDV